MATHLKYYYPEAVMDFAEKRHAEEVLQELGITYQHCTMQSIADSYWFWNCENIPDNLPKFITPLNVDPMKFIGLGLSTETAEKIRDYKKL